MEALRWMETLAPAAPGPAALPLAAAKPKQRRRRRKATGWSGADAAAKRKAKSRRQAKAMECPRINPVQRRGTQTQTKPAGDGEGKGATFVTRAAYRDISAAWNDPTTATSAPAVSRVSVTPTPSPSFCLLSPICNSWEACPPA